MDTTTTTPAAKPKYETKQAERKKLRGSPELPASLSGESVEDLKFFAFSRRTRSGKVDTPLPIVTNTMLLCKASSHFEYLLGTGFSENNLTEMDAPYPSTRPSVTESYDYMSDSDLEEEDEEGNATQCDGPSIKAKTEPGTEMVAPDHADETTGADAEGRRERTDRIAKPGRVVFLEDIAHTTWKAFAFYAYFGEVAFAPLRSEHKPRPQERSSYDAPLCSPKSMYRVAEKYDVVTLKDQALASIKSSLSPRNVLEELFSSFTSIYPVIQELELQYLYDNIKDTGVQTRLPTWLDALERGFLPKGAASIMGRLMSKLINTPPQIITRTVEVPVTAPLQPGMKKCPGRCTEYRYWCYACSSDF